MPAQPANPQLPENSSATHLSRLPVLDGWRAISILAVLYAHLGPFSFPDAQSNVEAGILAMALFFALSGFLITSTLYLNLSVRAFVIRRFARIVPLTWLYLVIALSFAHVSKGFWAASLLFYVNHWPMHLNVSTDHLWSLSVEMQFYLLIAVLVAVLRRWAFFLLPVLAIGFTLHRVVNHQPVNIMTEFRIDEILSGATLAWLLHSRFAPRVRALLSRLNPAIPCILLLCSCSTDPRWTAWNYPRPYFAALLLGATICQPQGAWARSLNIPVLSYLAKISFSLYVWHRIVFYVWGKSHIAWLSVLCSLPLGLFVLLAIAHLTTYTYERFFMRLGRKFADRFPVIRV